MACGLGVRPSRGPEERYHPGVGVPEVDRQRIGVASRVTAIRNAQTSRVVCIPKAVLSEVAGAVHEYGAVDPTAEGFTVELLPADYPPPPTAPSSERREQRVRRLGREKSLRTVTLPAQVTATIPGGTNAVEWGAVEGPVLCARWVKAKSNRPWADKRRQA